MMASRKIKGQPQSTWKQFKKNRLAVGALWLVVILSVVALLADVLATRHPWYVRYQGETYYPAFQVAFHPEASVTLPGKKPLKARIAFDRIQWKQTDLGKVVWAPIPYNPNEPDPFNRNYKSPLGTQKYRNPDGTIENLPLRLRHFLGTDKLGRDVMSGLIHGARTSLGIGILGMGIATIIGMLAGALAGYYGDRGFFTAWIHLLLWILGLMVASFYGFVVPQYAIGNAFAEGGGEGLWALGKSLLIFGLILSFFDYLGRRLARFRLFSRKISIPVDGLLLRIMELLRAIPALILLITVRAVTGPFSFGLLVVLIGLIFWTGIARFMRAELLRNRNLDYIEAARALGFRERRIVFGHAMPNALAPVFTAIAFGIAIAILSASSLAFLGLGIAQDTVTWGSLLRAGQERFTAWWLVVFPGLAIFLTILLFNLIGEGLRDATDPRYLN